MLILKKIDETTIHKGKDMIKLIEKAKEMGLHINLQKLSFLTYFLRN